jgi:hypothetical protein
LTAAGRIQRYSNTLFGNERDPHISPEVKVRKVVVSELVTLDGVIEDPGGGEGFEHAGWAFRSNRKTTPLRLVQATPVGPDGVVILTYEQ